MSIVEGAAYFCLGWCFVGLLQWCTRKIVAVILFIQRGRKGR